MNGRGRLAIDGGEPVRRTRLPYARQSIDATDVAAVSAVLTSDWLTTGPEVARFERAFAAAAGTRAAVAVSSGTAALHLAMLALDLEPGDEVIVPSLSFAATASCVAYVGARPVFADVDPDTLLVDPADVERRLTPRTRAIVAMDYAGQPCDYAALGRVAERRGLALVADACHSLGASYAGRPVGSLARWSAFSLHPAKVVTAGEGGVVTTDEPELAERLRALRQHGISTARPAADGQQGWLYEQVELGFNYRLTDIQCALATSQLARLPVFLDRRREIARCYDAAFADSELARPLVTRAGCEHAHHLYVLRLELDRPGFVQLGASRGEIYEALRAEGIGVQVHFIPIHLHPYYQRHFGTAPGDCPRAEAAYERILSLPLYPAMTEADVGDVIRAVRKVLEHFACSRSLCSASAPGPGQSSA